MIRIAMIGCGAIGAGVLEHLRGDPDLQVGWVVLPEGEHVGACETAARLAPQARVVRGIEAEAGVDLLVECAGHAAIEEHVIPALRRGIPCMVASVGALSAQGIEAPFHYVPLHSSDAGRRFGRTVGPLTLTDELSARLIRLPLWSGMGSERERVIDCVHELTKRPGRSARA